MNQIYLTTLIFFTIAKMAFCQTPQVEVLSQALGEGLEVFTKVIEKVECPELKSRARSSPDESELTELAMSIGKEIDAVKLVWNAESAPGTIRDIENLIKTKKWLRARVGYGNFVISASCDYLVSRALIVGLKKGLIDVERVLSLLTELSSASFSNKEMLLLLKAEAGEADAVRNVDPGNFDVLRTARMLAEGQKKSLMEFPGKLLSGDNVGGVLEYFTMASTWSVVATVLAEYKSRGGDLELSESELAQDLKKRVPESFEKKVDATGGSLYPQIVAAGVKRATR